MNEKQFILCTAPFAIRYWRRVGRDSYKTVRAYSFNSFDELLCFMVRCNINKDTCKYVVKRFGCTIAVEK